MKKGAIFDMDGLLFDTERIYQDGWRAMAVEFGLVPHPDFPAAVCGTSGVIMRETIRRYYPEVDPQAFVTGCVRWAKERFLQDVPVMPGAREILTFFQERGVKIALASSSSREVIESNLRRNGFQSFFDAVVCGADVRRGKPEPGIFLLAAERLGCKPEDCYVFEDGVNGSRAGIAAGCATVMIPDLTPPTEDLRERCAGIYPSLTAAQEAIAAGRL